ncbi:hypothetical protein N7468_003093 [Penicillium chermesinum]|uniref:Rhodopsin domain-containing protein n=1 Tax=Penicillium chermesinum TaxID=63820 RepID=A0A9W9P5T5_9EURO|nr:uncharacterized protein N7468_003093 [Penicillium chermesinum]KAJ5238474.1 hypothetical protein N7468_003093 [Penicillium chermesinum]
MASTTLPTVLPDSAPSLVDSIRAMIGLFTGFELVVCLLRLYVRRFITRQFGLDDYLVIVSVVLQVAFAAISLVLTTVGLGYHQDTVPTSSMIQVHKYVYILFCLYLWAALAVKCSLTVFIMRLFPTKWVKRAGWAIIAVMILVTVSGEIPLIVQCNPIEGAWDPNVKNAKCFSPKTLEYIQLYQAILMLIFDVLIVALPIPTVWKLQMPLSRRLVVIGLFSLGLIACSCGLARIPLLGFQASASDYTYLGGVPLILMNVEYTLGLIAGSLPSLRVLLKSIPGLNSSGKGTPYPTRTREWESTTNGNGGYQLTEPTHWSQKWMSKKSADVDSIESESQQPIVIAGKAPDRT